MLSTSPSDVDDQCYRLAVQSAATGLGIIDLQGRWVDVNPTLAKLLGQAADTLIGVPVSRSFPSDDAEQARTHLAMLADNRSPIDELPQRYRNPAGNGVAAHAEATVMRDADGAPCYLLMQLQPRSPLAGDAQALQQALAESEDKFKGLAEEQELFTRGLSHDLRAPLRAIESFSLLLESHSADALDERGRDHLQRIRAAAARMGTLIDALLDLARIDRTELSPEPVDISMLADWVAADLRDAAPQRDADIVVTPGLQASGNERLLRMLLQQLLDNAWRFSVDRERVDITVDGKVADGRLQVAVRDHGSGFDMRYVERIFEPFQRLHAAEEGAGNGIGLAIARRVVERHGGQLHAQSEPGIGSVFSFDLPAAGPEQDEAG